MPPGHTTCAVIAASVVLMAHTCRSWTSATSGSPSKWARTASGSIPSGTASIARSSDSRNSPHVPQATSPATARLATGSIQSAPVSRIARPAATTPRETSASTAMCANAARTFRSPLRPDAKSHAVTPKPASAATYARFSPTPLANAHP